MSTPILRPVFRENQILSADDVNTIVSHSRDARARHNRYLHSWGIATGLDLLGEEREDTSGKFLEVNLSPGMAIDGSGREIIVTESIRLSEDSFDQLNVVESNNDPQQHYYPVFLVGRDRRQDSSVTNVSVCESGSTSRVREAFDVEFGRVGSAAELGEQPVPELGAGIAGTDRSDWRVLVGFVTWDGAHFAGVAESADGISRRYVGVRGEEVVGLGDGLSLRSAERATADKAALVIDNQNGGEMRFGLHDGQGEVVPVLTVNAQGDVIAEGKILGAIAGGVQVESGVITDGLEVPLPAGITQAQIDDGEASVQIQVQPRFQQPASLPSLAAGEFWLMQPIDCHVTGRRVVCLLRWQASDGSLPALLLPGACDYTVMGFVKKEAS
ncbi:MAG: hypothetical protein ACR2RB_10360 [Gammaproteobacteria bacterium]